jgi:hypothetical protein
MTDDVGGSNAGGLTIAGERGETAELAAVVDAARALFRSCAVEGEPRDRADPLRVTVDGALLWQLGEAIDGPYKRREWSDPALRPDAVPEPYAGIAIG